MAGQREAKLPLVLKKTKGAVTRRVALGVGEHEEQKGSRCDLGTRPWGLKPSRGSWAGYAGCVDTRWRVGGIHLV